MAQTAGIHGHGSIPAYAIGKDDIHTSDLQGVFLGKKVRVDASAGVDSLLEFELREESFGQEPPATKEKKAQPRSEVRQLEKKALDSAQKRLPDFRGSSFDRFMSVLRRSKHSRNFEDVKEEAASLFPEPSHRHAAFVAAANLQGDGGGDESLSQFLRQHAEELMNEKGPEIQASYNISEAALQELGSGLTGLQEGRDFYRKAVFSFEVPGESYRIILEESPPAVSGQRVDTSERTPQEAVALTQKLQGSLKFLRQCLGADLQSITPSKDATFLRTVMDCLYHVEFLGNAHESGLQLLEKFQASYDSGIQIQPYRLMRHVLDSMNADYLPPDRFLEVSWEMRVPPGEITINFLTQLHELIRQLPLKVYPTPESREVLLQAVQLSLDAAIDEEQKALGEVE